MATGLSATAFEALKAKLWGFMQAEIYPNEQLFAAQSKAIGEASHDWHWPPILLELKRKAKAQGLWNLFLPVDSAAAAGVDQSVVGGGLTNRQYAEICEIMGTSCHAEFAAMACNCASPDTGNMEVLARYGTAEQKRRWLVPLLEGRIRSCFAMTEPSVASSDATNIGISIARDELLVPMDTPGLTLLRPMRALGEDDAPKGHMEILFENVRVPFENVLLGEGRGFEISQGRLGPGRIHHCMRSLGQAERALSLMCRRVGEREAFGKKLARFDTILQDIARSRCELDTCRLLVHKAAELMDTCGNKDPRTRQLLSMVKDTPLFAAFAGARGLRLADGPDEVHLRTAAAIELRMQQNSPLFAIGHYPVDRTKVFRRTTDPVSPHAQRVLDAASKL